MKTILDKEMRDDLVRRMDSLHEHSIPVWGKMNLFQMVRHCIIWNEWVLGTRYFDYRQELLGRIFGKMALKSNTRDDRPMSRNMPAGKTFKVKERAGAVKLLIPVWAEQINAYEGFSNERFVHDFFGKMTTEEIGIFAFKHNDHHLRQFHA